MTVVNTWIGVPLTHVKTKQRVGKSKININVSAHPDGLEKCVMLKWSVVKMLRLEKVCVLIIALSPL